MTIKVLLLLALAMVGLIAVRGRRSASHLALRRLAGVVILSLGAFSVLVPNVVTSIANAVGVGRGTDLILYVLAVSSLFVWASLYRRVHELESELVRLSRRIAIQDSLITETSAAITQSHRHDHDQADGGRAESAIWCWCGDASTPVNRESPAINLRRNFRP